MADWTEAQKEEALFDYLAAREAALSAAIGSLVQDNIPIERLRCIAETTSNELVTLAARQVIFMREKGRLMFSVPTLICFTLLLFAVAVTFTQRYRQGETHGWWDGFQAARVDYTRAYEDGMDDVLEYVRDEYHNAFDDGWHESWKEALELGQDIGYENGWLDAKNSGISYGQYETELKRAEQAKVYTENERAFAQDLRRMQESMVGVKTAPERLAEALAQDGYENEHEGAEQNVQHV